MTDLTEEKKQELKKIEEKELHYLNKYYHFLKAVEDEMMAGFRTKETIKDDWFGKYGKDREEKKKNPKLRTEGISDFSVGAERIVYALLNGKQIGQPNSCPVGSDLFFEVDDAYIHIDLKTVQSENLNDYNGCIFIGENQNSYKGKIQVSRGDNKGKIRDYIPALPTYYNKGKPQQKICLSYFITILYDANDLTIWNINLLCMPNGELEEYYGSRVLRPGKTNKDKGKSKRDQARFDIKHTPRFELLDEQPYRVKVIYFNEEMPESVKSKGGVKFFEKVYLSQKE